jgi:hypothetical protein
VRRRLRRAGVAALLLAGIAGAAGVAAGDGAGSDPLSAADVAGAPRPDQARGVLVEDAPGAATTALWWAPRAILLLPGLVLLSASLPVSALAWAHDEYRLDDWARLIFFTEDARIGLYPVAYIETDFGVNVGARFRYRDIAGKGESFGASASYGRSIREISGAARTGQRLGRLEVHLGAQHQARIRDPFFGIGDADAVDPRDGEVMAPIDPFVDRVALPARFRQDVTRVALGVDARLAGRLFASITGGLEWRSFSEASRVGDDELELSEAYLTADLTGYGAGTATSTYAVELRHDTRRAASPMISAAMPSRGWLLAGFGGFTVGVDGDTTRFLRYGADVQRYLDLHRGTRVLILRLLVEGVWGGYDEIPFVDLPRLGGALHLRGYEHGRFRDRAAALASIEYQWDLSELVTAQLFVDTGRVFSSWLDLTPRDFRLGYGAGLQLHSRQRFILRGQVASSIDGGVFFNLSFDPHLDARRRLDDD